MEKRASVPEVKAVEPRPRILGSSGLGGKDGPRNEVRGSSSERSSFDGLGVL